MEPLEEENARQEARDRNVLFEVDKFNGNCLSGTEGYELSSMPEEIMQVSSNEVINGSQETHTFPTNKIESEKSKLVENLDEVQASNNHMEETGTAEQPSISMSDQTTCIHVGLRLCEETNVKNENSSNRMDVVITKTDQPNVSHVDVMEDRTLEGVERETLHCQNGGQSAPGEEQTTMKEVSEEMVGQKVENQRNYPHEFGKSQNNVVKSHLNMCAFKNQANSGDNFGTVVERCESNSLGKLVEQQDASKISSINRAELLDDNLDSSTTYSVRQTGDVSFTDILVDSSTGGKTDESHLLAENLKVAEVKSAAKCETGGETSLEIIETANEASKNVENKVLMPDRCSSNNENNLNVTSQEDDNNSMDISENYEYTGTIECFQSKKKPTSGKISTKSRKRQRTSTDNGQSKKRGGRIKSTTHMSRDYEHSSINENKSTVSTSKKRVGRKASTVRTNSPKRAAKRSTKNVVNKKPSPRKRSSSKKAGKTSKKSAKNKKVMKKEVSVVEAANNGEPMSEDCQPNIINNMSTEPGGLENVIDTPSPCTDPPLRRFVCEICGRGFKKRHDLNEHNRTHTGDRPFECHVCKKTFKRTTHLRLHAMMHTGEYPCICEECGRAFADKSVLKKHLRVHTGERPFKCEICQKTFADQGNLTVHTRIHTNDRRHMCEVCGKKFIDMSKLRQHLRIHTGEKPYACDTCGKTYGDRSHLTRHKRIHTGERPYTCEVCGKTFSLSWNMKRHFAMYHADDPPIPPKPFVGDGCDPMEETQVKTEPKDYSEPEVQDFAIPKEYYDVSTEEEGSPKTEPDCSSPPREDSSPNQTLESTPKVECEDSPKLEMADSPKPEL